MRERYTIHFGYCCFGIAFFIITTTTIIIVIIIILLLLFKISADQVTLLIVKRVRSMISKTSYTHFNDIQFKQERKLYRMVQFMAQQHLDFQLELRST